MSNALKDAKNPHFKNKYATLQSVREAVDEPLRKHGFAYTQTFEPAAELDAGVVIVTTLLHESGEKITSKLFVPATKRDAQGFGSCITYGRRYSLEAICGISSEDDDGNDGSGRRDRDRDEPPARQARPEPRREAGPPATDAPPANSDMSKTRREASESLAKWVNNDKAKAKQIVGYILPGSSSVGHMDDAKLRVFLRAWWLYRLCNGTTNDIEDVVKNVLGAPWFDKMSDKNLADMHSWCKQEAARIENEKAGHKTHSPSTKDENGDDPF